MLHVTGVQGPLRGPTGHRKGEMSVPERHDTADGQHPHRDSCRINVRFEHPPIELDYRDKNTVARHFAAAAARIGAVVTINHDLRGELPPLPCRSLWT
jgi:hypothetical protein